MPPTTIPTTLPALPGAVGQLGALIASGTVFLAMLLRVIYQVRQLRAELAAHKDDTTAAIAAVAEKVGAVGK